MRFDLAPGFPLVTTKRVHFKSIVYELLWFLRGETNIAYLREHGVTIWDEWADENGELGPVYGKQWRSWPARDGRHDRPDLAGRRAAAHAIRIRAASSSAPGTSASSSRWRCTPCHAFFQFYVSDGRLSCQLYQRSADIFLGVPFNIASYALLTHMLAQQCDLDVGRVHLDRRRLPPVFEPPRAGGRAARTRAAAAAAARDQAPAAIIFDYRFEDFEIANYQPHPAIKAPVAV